MVTGMKIHLRNGLPLFSTVCFKRDISLFLDLYNFLITTIIIAIDIFIPLGNNDSYVFHD